MKNKVTSRYLDDRHTLGLKQSDTMNITTQAIQIRPSENVLTPSLKSAIEPFEGRKEDYYIIENQSDSRPCGGARATLKKSAPP